MKKFFLSIMALLPFAAFAQINGSGYYRIQNKASQRFLLLVDNRASINWTDTSVDLDALKTIGTFEENVCWNPATICYVSESSKANYYNISGQGLDLYNIAQTYLKFSKQSDGTYIISGEATKAGATVAKTLYDSAKPKNPASINTGGTAGYQYWYVRPVKSTGNYYFGIKPDFQASMEDNACYYTTMYASFAFKLGEGMKAYYPTEISGEYVRVSPLYNSIPGAVPVIVECSSDTPSDNKVDLLTSSTAVTTGNKLTGVYYCNDVTDAAHRNVKEYSPTNMRVLGKAADGRLAFVTDRSLKYIPANKAYLTVPTGAPETLYVVTSIPDGIETISATGVMPRNRGVWTLSGQRLGDTTEGLSKGVYVVNGCKVVIK